MTGGTGLARSVREVELEPLGAVEITLPANSTRLRGVDGNRVTVRVPADRTVDEEVVIDEMKGRVRIRAVERGYRIGPIRMSSYQPGSIEIDLPRKAAVGLQTMSGDVVATGIDGESRWSTASGDLRLELGGSAITAESMSGDVIVTADRPTMVALRAVSGDVRMRARRIDDLTVSTTSGDIAVETDLGTSARHRLSSVSGSVELATASPVRVDVASITGDLRATGVDHSEGARGSRTLVSGDGSVPVAIRTTSGDIQVRIGRIDTPVHEATGALTEPANDDAEPANDDADVAAPTDAGSERDTTRLEILRALERGEIDVDAAERQLETMDVGSEAHG